MGTHQPIRKTVAPDIPDKLYFRIGDVAKLCEVPTYVLRFWETEFSQLKPNKGGTGQRLYRRKDVELALRIKSLLYDQGYTIPGARQVFKNEGASRSGSPVLSSELETASVAPTGEHMTLEPPDTGAAMRQQARLRDLRNDMAALLFSLEGKPATSTLPREPRAATAKLQTMRPRLVLESRPATLKLETSSTTRSELKQCDLFGREATADDEWPEPPVAS